ncbi:MAG TPA: TonB-dependent receptor, partial [Candidatus Acidoferrum sp.]|nr:TonB-dependent receptor [Candidatus Acidoferrum sp.]
MAALLMPAFTLAQPQPSDRSSAGLNDNLLASSLEELTQIQITSVARHQESLLQAAASVYVITADDIHRSGATTLPEVLRLAPTLQVARIDSVQYAITARGFNNTIGNKLLVLIDGRTVYTPMFSGVFWEMQDTMLEDIDRIEVISGPGATLWGANAVNGVINIITRPVAPHESTLVSADAGNQEQGAAVRGGGTLDGDVRWRAYARTRRWDETELESGAPVLNRYQRQQAGFRADWQRGSDDFTLQGDVFDGESEQRGTVGTITIPPLEGSGANLLARWDRHWSADSSLQVQAYWNHNDRREFVLFSPESDIYDIELQQNFALGSHRLVWGGGYRLGEDDVGDGFITGLRPQQSNLEWKDVYLQDEFPLAANLKLTTGLKLEWNDYTGMEYLPTLRLGWTVSANDFLWAAASRAVRAPSRYDRDVYFPQNPPYIVAGGPNFVSEVAKVYEVGYRGLIGSALQLSV